MKLMELMSKNPAEFYRMIPGSITKGAAADLVIFGEKELWTGSRSGTSFLPAGTFRLLTGIWFGVS